jgi:hypothetical protein
MAGAAASAAVLTAMSVTGAAAAPSGDPNVTRVANPAQACAAIPATLAGFGITPEGFDFSSCVKDVAAQVPNVAFGNPYEQCALLEEGVEGPFGVLKVTYPYVFHSEPGDPFPNLQANNREQCARALYVFHTLESYLPPPPPA